MRAMSASVSNGVALSAALCVSVCLLSEPSRSWPTTEEADASRTLAARMLLLTETGQWGHVGQCVHLALDTCEGLEVSECGLAEDVLVGIGTEGGQLASEVIRVGSAAFTKLAAGSGKGLDGVIDLHFALIGGAVVAARVGVMREMDLNIAAHRVVLRGLMDVPTTEVQWHLVRFVRRELSLLRLVVKGRRESLGVLQQYRWQRAVSMASEEVSKWGSRCMGAVNGREAGASVGECGVDASEREAVTRLAGHIRGFGIAAEKEQRCGGAAGAGDSVRTELAAAEIHAGVPAVREMLMEGRVLLTLWDECRDLELEIELTAIVLEERRRGEDGGTCGRWCVVSGVCEGVVWEVIRGDGSLRVGIVGGRCDSESGLPDLSWVGTVGRGFGS